jgi:hypothetical protein
METMGIEPTTSWLQSESFGLPKSPEKPYIYREYIGLGVIARCPASMRKMAGNCSTSGFEIVQAVQNDSLNRAALGRVDDSWRIRVAWAMLFQRRPLMPAKSHQ